MSVAETTPNPLLTYRLRPARRGDAPSIRTLVGELGFPEGADAQTVNWILSHPEMEVFVARTLSLIEETRPPLVVVLGDVLDTHIKIDQVPAKLAVEWLGKIARLSRLVLLIGNHDRVNDEDFLTDGKFGAAALKEIPRAEAPCKQVVLTGNDIDITNQPSCSRNTAWRSTTKNAAAVSGSARPRRPRRSARSSPA